MLQSKQRIYKLTAALDHEEVARVAYVVSGSYADLDAYARAMLRVNDIEEYRAQRPLSAGGPIPRAMVD